MWGWGEYGIFLYIVPFFTALHNAILWLSGSHARLHVMAVVTEGGFQNDLVFVFVFVFVFVSLNLFHVFGLFVCIKCAAPAPPCLCFCLPVDYVVGSQ